MFSDSKHSLIVNTTLATLKINLPDKSDKMQSLSVTKPRQVERMNDYKLQYTQHSQPTTTCEGEIETGKYFHNI